MDQEAVERELSNMDQAILNIRNISPINDYERLCKAFSNLSEAINGDK